MICECCKKPHDGSYATGRFCSQECARSYSTLYDKNDTKIVKCKHCGVDLEVDKRAGAVSCLDCKKRKVLEYEKTRRLAKGCKPRVTKPPRHCELCGGEMKKQQKRFCSRACQTESEWNKKKQYILDTNGTGKIGVRTLKRYLIETIGHQCSICNLHEWGENPIPLVLDHVNGRASDNRLQNLRLVCGNCDMLLPTYKSKNKNSDRQRIGKYI